MAKKMTQHMRLRACIAAAMHQVMDLTGLTELAYKTMQWECGVEYLRVSMHGDADSVSVMEQSKEFWQWWRLNWYLRDQEFVNDRYVRVLNLSQWRVDGNKLQQGYDPIVLARTLYARKHASGLQTKAGMRAKYRLLHDPIVLGEGLGGWGNAIEESYGRDLIGAVSGER